MNRRATKDIATKLAAFHWHAVHLYELSRRADRAGWPEVGILLLGVCRVLTGVEIMHGAEFGPGLSIKHGNGIVIGGGSKIGANCSIFHQVTIGSDGINLEQPVIGDDVTIFAGARVLGGVTVGDGAVIGANSVVLHDVAPGAMVAGIPAREVKDPTKAPLA